MSFVQVFLVDSDFLSEFSFSKDRAALARKYMAEGFYKSAAILSTRKSGEAAAEDAFDLTNNPNREDERDDQYGPRRSVSVGDIVRVINTGGTDIDYLCDSVGWVRL